MYRSDQSTAKAFEHGHIMQNILDHQLPAQACLGMPHMIHMIHMIQ